VRTSIGWSDPRGSLDQPDDVLAWPARFSPPAVAKLKAELGNYAWAGQYEQSPVPRGGGMFPRSWWKLWDPPDRKFPTCDYVIASLDSAFSDQEWNAPSALVVLGTFIHPDEKKPCIILIDAFRRHLQFSGPRIEREPAEILRQGDSVESVRNKNSWYRRRTMPTWGLIEHVKDICQRRIVHKLLIEAKASGISAAQELRNRFSDQPFSIELVQVKGNKIARAAAMQATFSQGLVYSPDKEWADMVMDEMENFPFGKYKDLTDAMSQGIAHLRAMGLAATDDEITYRVHAEMAHKGAKPGKLYPC
jgi:predicted phage terminase large subunit-like protein